MCRPKIFQRQKKANYSMLLGAMPNSASVNSAAMLTVNIMYPSTLDIGCIPHAVCVGNSVHTIFTYCLHCGSP